MGALSTPAGAITWGLSNEQYGDVASGTSNVADFAETSRMNPKVLGTILISAAWVAWTAATARRAGRLLRAGSARGKVAHSIGNVTYVRIWYPGMLGAVLLALLWRHNWGEIFYASAGIATAAAYAVARGAWARRFDESTDFRAARRGLARSLTFLYGCCLVGTAGACLWFYYGQRAPGLIVAAAGVFTFVLFNVLIWARWLWWKRKHPDAG